MDQIRTKVSFGLSSVWGFVLALATVALPVIGELADVTAPLNVPSEVWLVIATSLACITYGGRMWQAAKAAGRAAIGNVPIGPSTIIGFGAAAAAALVTMIGGLADVAEPFNIPASFWAVTTAVLSAVAILGRMRQAVGEELLSGGNDPNATDLGDAGVGAEEDRVEG